MTEPAPRHHFYWERFSAGGEGPTVRLPPGDELAALRRGLGVEPGTVPSMWRFYCTWQDDRGHSRFAAEHHALTLFAVHQQSQRNLVHVVNVPMARALRRLHTSDRFAEAAVDQRFFAAATAPEVDEVAYHLRGLVRQLRSLHAPAPFDYTQLFWDLARWSSPEGRQRTRRKWGLDYYGTSSAVDPGLVPSTEGDL